MDRKRITKFVIGQTPPAKDRVEVRDTDSPLILRITAQGTRSFIVRARVKGKKQPIRLTYKTPAHISVLEEARAWAVETVGLSRRGTDPREDKASSEAAQRAEAEKRRSEPHDLMGTAIQEGQQDLS